MAERPVLQDSAVVDVGYVSEPGIIIGRLNAFEARQTGGTVWSLRYHNVYGPHGTWQGGREKAPAAISRKACGTRRRWSAGSRAAPSAIAVPTPGPSVPRPRP